MRKNTKLQKNVHKISISKYRLGFFVVQFLYHAIIHITTDECIYRRILQTTLPRYSESGHRHR